MLPAQHQPLQRPTTLLKSTIKEQGELRGAEQHAPKWRPDLSSEGDGVDLLLVLQNLSINLKQNIVGFFNKFLATPFIRNPPSRFHQSDVLLLECHNTDCF